MNRQELERQLRNTVPEQETRPSPELLSRLEQAIPDDRFPRAAVGESEEEDPARRGGVQPWMLLAASLVAVAFAGWIAARSGLLDPARLERATDMASPSEQEMVAAQEVAEGEAGLLDRDEESQAADGGAVSSDDASELETVDVRPDESVSFSDRSAPPPSEPADEAIVVGDLKVSSGATGDAVAKRKVLPQAAAVEADALEGSEHKDGVVGEDYARAPSPAAAPAPTSAATSAEAPSSPAPRERVGRLATAVRERPQVTYDMTYELEPFMVDALRQSTSGEVEAAPEDRALATGVRIIGLLRQTPKEDVAEAEEVRAERSSRQRDERRQDGDFARAARPAPERPVPLTFDGYRLEFNGNPIPLASDGRFELAIAEAELESLAARNADREVMLRVFDPAGNLVHEESVRFDPE